MSKQRVQVSRCEENNVFLSGNQEWFLDYLPVTGGNQVDLYIDGKEYGLALREALLSAKKQVLLTGLHFEPHWRLVRGSDWTDWSKGVDLKKEEPIDQPHKDSLLGVLQTVAEKGVQIYLIVNQFWKYEVARYKTLITSDITEEGHLDWYLPRTIQLFNGLASYNNVHCRTDVHRGFVMSTHHQKTVVIDEKVAFVGGIDLTDVDGDRWDTFKHEIPLSGDQRRISVPEPLWHDVHCRIEGPAAMYVLDNFHARWNHGQLLKNLAIKQKPTSAHPDLTGAWYPPFFRLNIVFGYLSFEEDTRNRHHFKRLYEYPEFEKNILIYSSKSKQSGITSRRANPEMDLCRSPTVLPSLEGSRIEIEASLPNAEQHNNLFGQVQAPLQPASSLDAARLARNARLSEARTALDLQKRYAYDSVSCSVPRTLQALEGTRVQIVRSMPQGSFDYNHQKPPWNLSSLSWERSAKDAYIIGIRAARHYIYLENQWISDEDIWAELELAMKRNNQNDKFRIVIVLPRTPLTAAGYGANQDMDIFSSVKAVSKACRSALQFGMYCLVANVPEQRRSELPHTEEELEKYGTETEQIYVHSKIMIVDDQWSLIGSANAGGISLTGVRNPEYGLGESTPDTELSAIIYDKNFAKQFRERLWGEHLQISKLGDKSVDNAADLFRKQASQKTSRVCFAEKYAKLVANAHYTPSVNRVPQGVIGAVKRSATIKLNREGDEKLFPETTVFYVDLLTPDVGYELHFRWSLRDKNNKSYQLRGVNTNRELKWYGPESQAFLSSDTINKLKSRLKGLQAMKILCRIMVTVRGVEPNDHCPIYTARYSFRLEQQFNMFFS